MAKDANEFQIEILEDGKISIRSVGSFDKTVHRDADEFLEMIKELAGGEVEVKKLQPGLGQHTHTHQHHKQ